MRTLQTVVKADRTARGLHPRRMPVLPRRHCRQRSAPCGRSARNRQEPRSLLRPHDDVERHLRLTLAPLWRVVAAARNRRECRPGLTRKSINLLSYIRHKTFYKRAGRVRRFCGEIASYVEHTKPSIRCGAVFRRRRRRIARICGRRRRLSYLQSAVSADQDTDSAKPASRRMEAWRNDPQ